MKKATRRRITDALRTWDKPGSKARQRYEASGQEWAKAIKPLEDAVEASEQLTEDDLAVYVNV